MGYDMSLEAPSEDLVARKLAGQKAFDDACAARDSYEWERVVREYPELLVPTRDRKKPDAKNDWDTEPDPDSLVPLGSLERNGYAWRSAAFKTARDLVDADDSSFPAERERLQALVGESYTNNDPTYFRLNIWGMSQYRDLMESIGMVHWDPSPEWPKAEDFGCLTIKERYINSVKASDLADPDAAAAEPGADVREYDDYDEGTDEYRAYEEAQEAVKGFEPSSPGIAGTKLCSNDWWLVTPAECESALEIWEALDGDTKRAYAIIATTEEEDAKHIAAAARLSEGEGGVVTATSTDTGERVVAVLIDPYVPDSKNNYWDAWIQFIRDGAQYGGFRVG